MGGLATSWALPAQADRGGPGVCGYEWTDSNEPPPQVNFTWIDIVDNGTKIVDWNRSADEGFAGPFPLGFAFVFYDVVYTDVFIETNGYVSFGEGWGWVPSPWSEPHEPPNNFASAYGADLDPSAATDNAGVYYEMFTAPNRFLVEFYQIPSRSNYTRPVTFEVVLYETGEIWFQYLEVTSQPYVVGIEDSAGSARLFYDRNVTSGLAVRIAAPTTSPAPVAVDLSPCNQGLLTIPGAVEQVPLTVMNAGTDGEDVFDLTVDAPSGWNIRFHDADGVTPLNDTDGDGVPDTGPLAPSASRALVLRIEVPSEILGDEILNATATSSDDISVSDNGYARLRIVPARLAPLHQDRGDDPDGDGQFDLLVVDVNLEVGIGSYLNVFAYFHNERYSIILDDYESAYFPPGTTTLTFTYDGRRINASDQDGPYFVDLAIVDPYYGRVIQRDMHVTQIYSHLEFETPLAALRPPHSDFSDDTDADGRYDYLVLDANVSVDRAGYYYLSVDLCNWINGSGFCTSTSNLTYLESGPRTIRSLHDGRRINGSGVDGPYLATMHLYEYGAWQILDREEHTTAAYSHLDFEAPKATFSPPHFDGGQDIDGDGLFDLLNVDATVAVDEPGNYTLGGYLHDANYSFSIYGYNHSYLAAGNHSFWVTFDGAPINVSGQDGPYVAELWLYDRDLGWEWDRDIHTTFAYESSDFNGPTVPASFRPPHDDSGWDSDGDGDYNYLVVEATVAIREAGPYSVRGRLHGSDGGLSLYADNYTYLGTGIQAISLLFEGRFLNASGVNGPYTVDLTLYSGYYGWLDDDTHTTDGYSHDDFDGPPARFVAPHDDHGEDTDGDGRFNFLVADVNVVTEISSQFYVAAALSYGNGGNGSLYLTKSEWLEAGAHTIEFRFDGVILNATEADGPYRVDLVLWDAYSGFMDNDTLVTRAYRHTAFEELPSILSRTGTSPTIDGSFASGEWSDAVVLDLSSVEGNGLPAYLYVKDDNRFLYVAYDVVGDTVPDPYDVASIAFDTFNDGQLGDGHEDVFIQGTSDPSQQAHVIWTSQWGWTAEDGPFNPDLPNHTGLASAYGFGSSPRSGTAHRIFEFAIPLALIQARPGDTIGFEAGSPFAPGVGDGSSYRYSGWPFPDPVPPLLYGDLSLSRDTLAPSLAITTPTPSSLFSVDSLEVTWTASDVGLGLDRFEVSVDGNPPTRVGPEASSIPLSDLSDGSHTITVTAWDGAGNSQTVEVMVTIDTISPTLEIASPAPRATLDHEDVAIAWVAADQTSGIDRIEVSVDGGSAVRLGPDQSTYTSLALADGSHRVTIVAFDEAGHTSSVSRVFFVDTVRPVLAIQVPAHGSTLTARDVSVSWFAIDLGSGLDRIEISLDGMTPVILLGNASGYTFVGIADGPHTIVVTAFDFAGNRLEATATFRVDTNPLSPSGAYGIVPLSAMVVVIAVAVALFVRRYRARRPPAS